MKTLRLATTALVAVFAATSTAGTVAASPTAVPAQAVTAHSTPATPTLVGIRAAHHPGYDRVVFDFRGKVPSYQVNYVTQLIQDGSGLPVPIAGRAVLKVRLEPAQAHKAGRVTAPGRIAFALPNVMTVVRAGDFEGVTTYGIGLAKRQSFHVFTLRNPSRVVVDIKAAFPTVQKKVYFFDQSRYLANEEPFFRAVRRPVLPLTPAAGVMDRLFAGPLPAEKAQGLRLLRSKATGWTRLSINRRGVARVQLTGDCSSGGSTVSIAGEIFPTLRQFASVDFVKIYDPSGDTEVPWGRSDSIPVCLEP